MHAPSDNHLQAVKRIMRYLKQTQSYGLKILRNDSPLLSIYINADWARNHDDRTSTSGCILYLGNNPVSWCSRKQKTIARSSTESEYRTVAAVVAESN